MSQSQTKSEQATGGIFSFGFGIIKSFVFFFWQPIVLAILGYVLYSELRQSFLFALFVLSAFYLVLFAFRFLKLALSAMTFNIIGIFRNLKNILFSLFFLLLLWTAYVYFYGTDFVL
ncbi:MAG: hypothetical protein QY330_00325 [Candidatus Dojkabacteria bacterium]|nr:MAG: hypothetical protein QY330_00325 [Candidatus Dojkabacteria bacterium]